MELKPPPTPPSETTSLPPTLFLFQVDEVILENECVKKKKRKKSKRWTNATRLFFAAFAIYEHFAAFDLYLYSPKGLFITQAALMLNCALSFHQKHNQTTARSRFRPYCCHCDYFSESHTAPGDTAAVSEGNK